MIGRNSKRSHPRSGLLAIVSQTLIQLNTRIWLQNTDYSAVECISTRYAEPNQKYEEKKSDNFFSVKAKENPVFREDKNVLMDC